MKVLNKTFPTLYKTTAAARLQQWRIFVEVEGKIAYITTVHGQYEGKQQTSRVKVDSGKNTGRANETDYVQQAISEAQSKWNKQLDKGYSENMVAKRVLRPMLAQSYDKHGSKIEWPAFLQPKLDGIRCLAYMRGGKVILESRKGKQFKCLQHIENELLNNDSFVHYMQNQGVLDGELYRHDEAFEELASAIKRDQPSDKSHLIQYHIYDLVEEADSFLDRHGFVIKLFQNYSGNTLIKVPTIGIIADDVWTFHKQYTDEGYEGVMLRNARVGYYEPDKRSYNLQKVKEFITEEFEIIDVEHGKGKFEHVPTFVCVTPDGAVFRATPEGSDEVRHEYWERRDELIGEQLTVRFFEWTKDKVPRFPVGVAIRDYE